LRLAGSPNAARGVMLIVRSSVVLKQYGSSWKPRAKKTTMRTRESVLPQQVVPEGAIAMDSYAAPTVEVEYERGGALRQVALVLDPDKGVWRGTTSWQEALTCVMPPDDVLLSALTIELSRQMRRLRATCRLSLDTFRAQVTVSARHRRDLTQLFRKARVAALRLLATDVADELEACDARFRSLVDVSTRAIANHPAALPHAAGRDASYPPKPADPARGPGYLSGAYLTGSYLTGSYLTGGYLSATSRPPQGLYGAAPSQGRYLSGAYLPQSAQLPDGSWSEAYRAAMATAPATSAFDPALEALSLRLLLLQNLQAALG
jgi:hypothetical protein